MPPTRRRSSALIQKDSIDQANTALQQLPEKPKESLSLREAIAELKDTIKAALDRGYSYEEVAAMLSEKGVKISPTSLKSYLAASQKGTAKSGRGRRRSSTAAIAEPASESVAVSSEAAPKRRGGRKPKSVEAPAAEASAAPTNGRRRGRAPASAPAAKSTTRRTKTAEPAAKPTSSTRGRRKKTV